MPDLPSLCDAGQRALVATDYLEAESLLEQAESLAWNARDWDTLSRLYMPLQETRRQRRQRCGEGKVKLDLLFDTPTAPRAEAETRHLAEEIITRYPHGQLLVADTASIALALAVRRLARERKLYVETFLAAKYSIGESYVIAVVPTDIVTLPPNDRRPLDRLLSVLPPFSGVFSEADVIRGERTGSDVTFGVTMALWERLHTPFLAQAEASTDPVRKMAEFRRVIQVDYACELAHQQLAKTAHQLARAGR